MFELNYLSLFVDCTFEECLRELICRNNL